MLDDSLPKVLNAFYATGVVRIKELAFVKCLKILNTLFIYRLFIHLLTRRNIKLVAKIQSEPACRKQGVLALEGAIKYHPYT